MSREPDSCPGALHLHDAADGPLARIRIPGGMLTPAQLEALADAAETLGNGELELTSRGNVQLRSVRDAVALQDMLDAAELLPSRTHERVRNIVASPLSGRGGGLSDIRELVIAFDEELQGLPALATLPGRVLFGFDDGRGDITALAPDLGVQATGDSWALILAGRDSGARSDRPLETLIAAAQAFLEIRDDEWRLDDVPRGTEQVLERLGLTPIASQIALAPPQHPIGWLEQGDGRVTLAGGLRFGTLTPLLARLVGAVTVPITVTPWRSLLLHDLDEDVADTVVRFLAPLGIIFDAHSPWLEITACAGKPRCAKAIADVRADATEAVRTSTLPVAGYQHWSGCARRCGKPAGSRDVVATAEGYRAN